MEEVELLLENEYPFCALSKKHPDVTFYRWCNSAVDYIEFYGSNSALDKLEDDLTDIGKALRTTISYKARDGKRLSVMFSCRCTLHNSTIRMVESDNCMWEAPVRYGGGKESLKLFSLKGEYFTRLYGHLSAIGQINIIKKKTVVPESLRETYTISISSLFGDMTDIQLSDLELALQYGHFSIPRKTDISELAKMKGVSKSTMQEHINKAKAKLMNAIEPYVRLYATTKRSTESEMFVDYEERKI
jgi:predicted DNA binding protein